MLDIAPLARAFSTILVIAVAATAALAPGTADAGPPPNFKLQDLDGNWVTLSEELGDDVVYVTFWATWCVPCRREMPYLQALHEELGDKGLTIIGVNTDPPSTTSKIKPYLKRYKISYTMVLDPDNNVLDKYNPTRELPYAVLIDRDGNVAEIFPGYRKGDEAILRDKVIELLGEGSDVNGKAAAGETD